MLDGYLFYADTNPRIAQLMRLKTADGEKVEIIKSLTPQWRQLGLLMDFDKDGRTVDLIKAEHQSEGQTVLLPRGVQAMVERSRCHLG